jgi:hypothetical protein
MSWEKTRETYEDNSGVHSRQATRWGVEGAFELTRGGKQYQIRNRAKFNTLKEISTRMDEIDEQLGNNPPDNVRNLLTNYRQYLIDVDSDLFNLAKGYNISDPDQVVPTLSTLYVSNYNMINQLVNQVQELYKKLETNNETPVGSAYNYVKSKKPPSGGRTRINKKQKINRKSRKNPKRRLRE